MDDCGQASDGEGPAGGRGPMVSACCVFQLVALVGSVWTGVSLGVRYAHGDPFPLAAGKVLLGLVLGFIAGTIAAIVILWIDHITTEWALRRCKRSQQTSDDQGEDSREGGTQE